MISRLKDLYCGVLWLGGLSAIALPAVISITPASYSDGLNLSIVLSGIFFIVTALITFIGVNLRNRRQIDYGQSYVLSAALRQAFLVGGTSVVLLILQLLRIITVIDAVLIVILALMIELALASRKGEYGN